MTQHTNAELLPLGELGDIASGSTPKTSVKEYWNGEIPWITPADLTNHEGVWFRGKLKRITKLGFEACSTRILPRGSILFSSRAPIGHCAVAAYPLCTNQGFKSLVPNQRLDSVYGYFALRAVTPSIVSQGRGATFAEVSKEIMESVRIPVRPLPEQKRIAALLEKADRLRRTHRYARQLSDTFLQSVFLEMFGDPATNSKGWDIEPFEDSLEDIDAGVNFKPIGDNEPASPWRVLKVSAVTSGEFKPFESKPISPDVVPLKKLIVQDGDFLMSRANTVELVGAVCIVRAAPPKVLLPDKLWRVRFATESKLVPDYALILLQSREMRRRIGSVATGTSGSMKNITQEDAASLLLPVPPLSLQQEFADIVRHFERLRAQQREAERQAEHLFQTLLHRAFTGE